MPIDYPTLNVTYLFRCDARFTLHLTAAKHFAVVDISELLQHSFKFPK